MVLWGARACSVDRLILFLATGAYFGYFPFFPGTVGSLLGVGLHLLLSLISGYLHILLLLSLIGLGVPVAGQAEALLGSRDAKPIIIDEILGYQIAMLLLPSRPISLFLAFLLFRFYDIWKPFPIQQSQKLPGGLGVVADDLVAGAYTNITLRILNLFFRGF